MYLLIIFAALEIIAIVVVVGLCVTARRADERTERTLNAEEIAARRQTSDAPRRVPVSAGARHTAERWLNRLFRAGRRDGGRN